jgi:hypothetical protein
MPADTNLSGDIASEQYKMEINRHKERRLFVEVAFRSAIGGATSFSDVVLRR